jgi:hypothetical protein
VWVLEAAVKSHGPTYLGVCRSCFSCQVLEAAQLRCGVWLLLQPAGHLLRQQTLDGSEIGRRSRLYAACLHLSSWKVLQLLQAAVELDNGCAWLCCDVGV